MKSLAFLVLLHVCVLIGAATIQNTVDDTDVDSEPDDDKKCPPWDKWQSSKCLWPTQPLSSIPKACVSLPKKPEIPTVLKQFVQSKQVEIYSIVQNLFKIRGAKSACGYCSRKIRCRQRKGGEWTKGCPFIQAQMVNEECPGQKACEVSPILGACPPPVPMPPPPRKKPDQQTDIDGRLQKIDSNLLGDKNLEIGVDKKNTTQAPPIWHCARNKDGSKCLCCCGWYFPNVNSGKCVSIRKDDAYEDDEQIWNWSGLMDVGDQYPWGFDGAIGDGVIEQIEAPPMEIVPPSVDADVEEPLVDQMPNPPAMIPQAPPTADQISPPKIVPIEKKPVRETEI